MKDDLDFRKINEFEKKIIINSISNISSRLPQVIEKIKNNLYISIESLNLRNKFPNIYFIPNHQIKILRILDNDKIISAGLYFGFIKEGNFFLSLEGVEFLFKTNRVSDLIKIKVNEKGEKSILYGNNILKNMVVEISEDTKKKDILGVFNKFDEIIAIAQSKCDHQKFQKLNAKDTIAITLNDKGYYLRKNQ